MAKEEDYDYSANVKDYVKRYETPYRLEQQDIESIASIKKTIGKGYNNAEQATEHFKYLELLGNKLANIHIEEQKYGITNESLPASIAEIRELLLKVKSVISALP